MLKSGIGETLSRFLYKLEEYFRKNYVILPTVLK